MSVQKNNKGFSLLEVIVAGAIFLIFALGIYGGIQMVFQIVYQSRLRILETAILNEQVEIIRNMSFFDVGIVNGSPSGYLERTVTTTRNGIDFSITRTIRNIDDPFDGTIGGTPNDTAPADYKFVEVEIRCMNGCVQRNPLSLSTYVAPKYLEGNPDNGALFIEVIDASGQPVSDADVRIFSTSTSPTYDFVDTTGDDGFLRVVDLAAGQQTYHIIVTKDGYTTDMTTTSVTNPFKPPASVVAQSVTSRTFTIDVQSSITVETLSNACNPIGSINLDITGERIIGSSPDVQLTRKNVNTDGVGSVLIDELPWDTYSLIPNGYDLLGAIPMLPVAVLPGASVDISLILGTNTAHSLLVHIQDSATQDPVSLSTVQVRDGGGYDESRITGVGTIRQTDWSGGPNQELYSDESRYWTDDGNIEITTPGDITLLNIGSAYVPSGTLESSIIDLGTAVNFVNIDWASAAQPVETGAESVRVQIATSNSSTIPVWDYLGPDGTNSTFYTVNEQNIHPVHNDQQFLRYKVYLDTVSSTFTPTVSDMAITYVTSCTPPGQAYFSELSESTYTLDVSAVGYTPYTSDIDVNGDTLVIIELVAE